jgi:hypothetical protein
VGAAVVADPDVLDALEISSSARRVLAEQGVVVIGRIHVSALLLPNGRRVAVRATKSGHGAGPFSNVLITAARARSLGLRVTDNLALYRADRPLTARQRSALDDIRLDAMDVSVDPTIATTQPDVDWQEPRSGPTPFQLELLLTAIALVFSVLVVGASLALAAAESRDERDVLTVAGAPPRVLAHAAGAKAGLLATIGGAMAVPLGFLPVVVFSLASNVGIPLRLPWPSVGLLVLVVPACAFLAARAASGAAQRLRPVRVSTARFE